MRALRTLDTKLVTYSGSQEGDELYDLVLDPDERVNLVADPASAARWCEMRSRLAAERARLGDEDPVAQGAKQPGEWVARVFVEVIDADDARPIEGATITCGGSAELCPGSAVTSSNGRWFRCARTAVAGLRFSVQNVSAIGYASSGSLGSVIVDANTQELVYVVPLHAVRSERFR